MSPGEHRTHMQTQKKDRGRHKGQSLKLCVVLLVLYCATVFVAVYTVAERLFLESRGSVGLYRLAP